MLSLSSRNFSQSIVKTLCKQPGHLNNKTIHSFASLSSENNSLVPDCYSKFDKQLADTHKQAFALKEFATLPVEMKATFRLFDGACEPYTIGVLFSMHATLNSKTTDGRELAFLNLIESSQNQHLSFAVREDLARIRDALNSNGAFVGLNLRGRDLSKLVLSGLNLSGSDLSFAILHETDLDFTDLADADLEGAQFINVDLSNTDMTRVKNFQQESQMESIRQEILAIHNGWAKTVE